MRNDGEVARHISTVALTFLLLVSIFVAYMVFGKVHAVGLLSWHAFLMTLSFVFILPISILNISGLCFCFLNMSWSRKKILHASLGVLTITSAITSLVCVLYFKSENESKGNHFQSNHGIIGLTALVCTGASAIFGLLLNYEVGLRISYVCHPCFGISALALALTAECLGFQKEWFVELCNTTASYSCISLTAIAGIWVVIKPFIDIIYRVDQ